MVRCLLSILVLTVVACTPDEKLTIYTIGDSTMAVYNENTTPIRGWGQMLQYFAVGNTEVVDAAKAGRSSRTFYEEGYWKPVVDSLKKGDYVLIQFAHNDEKNGGQDGPNPRGTSPHGAFPVYLKKYVDETRAKGAIPVLVAPIIRRYFDDEGKITLRGQHNLGAEGTDTLCYVTAMKKVAEETNTPFIDLTARTREIAEEYGAEASARHLYSFTDKTHVRAMGAAVVARAAVQELRKHDILKDRLMDNPVVILNPVGVDFGTMFVGSEMYQTYDVVNFDPQTRNNYKISTQDSLLFSLTLDGERTRELDVDTTDSFTFFAFVRAMEPGKHVQKFFVGGNDCLLENYVTLQTVVPDTTMVAGFECDNLEMEHLRTSKINANKPGFSGLLNDENSVWVDGGWPAEIDEVGDRYFQFYVRNDHFTSIFETLRLEVDSRMSFRAAYGIGPDFNNRVDVCEYQGDKRDSATVLFEVPVGVTLNKGARLLVRIYPWSKEATGEKFVVKEVSLKGKSFK